MVRNILSAITITFALLTGDSSADIIKAPIEPNLESALAKSRITGRPVIVDFHAVY